MLEELETGRKVACKSCISGHRSTKCDHTDRMLVEVRTPGRPMTECPHVTKEACKCKSGTEARPRKVRIVVVAAISKRDAKRPCAKNRPTPTATTPNSDDDDRLPKKRSCCGSAPIRSATHLPDIAPRPSPNIRSNGMTTPMSPVKGIPFASNVDMLDSKAFVFNHNNPTSGLEMFDIRSTNVPDFTLPPNNTSFQLDASKMRTQEHAYGPTFQDTADLMTHIRNGDSQASLPSHLWPLQNTLDYGRFGKRYPDPPISGTFNTGSNTNHSSNLLAPHYMTFDENIAARDETENLHYISHDNKTRAAFDISIPSPVAGMPEANGTRDHPFTQQSQHLLATQHKCNCGTTCTCTGCPEHMYNPTMQNMVLSAYEAGINNQSSGIIEFPTTDGSDGTQVQNLNPDDWIYFEYELYRCSACFMVPSAEPTGKCMCGDSCDCTACETHRGVSSPTLPNAMDGVNGIRPDQTSTMPTTLASEVTLPIAAIEQKEPFNDKHHADYPSKDGLEGCCASTASMTNDEHTLSSRPSISDAYELEHNTVLSFDPQLAIYNNSVLPDRELMYDNMLTRSHMDEYKTFNNFINLEGRAE